MPDSPGGRSSARPGATNSCPNGPCTTMPVNTATEPRPPPVMPPISVMQIKEVVNAGLSMPLDVALAMERRAFAMQFATHDQKEGMRAFLEKRKSKFEGK